MAKLPLLLLLLPATCWSLYPACAAGLTCTSISPTDSPTLRFDCAHASGSSSKGLIYFMHGNDGVRPKGMFFEMMLELSGLGYSVLACDQRGYSPAASPSEYGAYNYDFLVQDMVDLVDASNMSHSGRFHLVAHDQGARVAWHAIGLGPSRGRLLSFSSLSIPHADVFSDSLYGASADSEQQAAAQYVRMLVLPNSTSAYNGAVFKTVCQSYGEAQGACQKACWWYNGAIDSGAMALAPMKPFGAIAKEIGIPYNVVKNLTQYPVSGVPNTVRVGRVKEFPVLYACGSQDGSDLCKQAFGDETGRLIDSKYAYLRLDGCGHDVLGCDNHPQVVRLHQAVITNIQSSVG